MLKEDFNMGKLNAESECVVPSFTLCSSLSPLYHAPFAPVAPYTNATLTLGLRHSMCVGGILGMEDGFPPNFAVIGDIFLKSCTYHHHLTHYTLAADIGLETGYTTFDYAGSRVGFAPSINNRK